MSDTYSRVVSTTALVLALGTGTAYAAELIGPEDIAANAVRSGHLLDGTVSSADVLNNALSGVDLADGSVRGADIASGAVSSVDIANGTVSAADLVPGLVPRGPQVALGAGIAPSNPVSSCCYSGPTVTLTKPTRLLVVLSTQDIGVGCSASGSCSLNVGAYFRNTSSFAITPVPGSAFTMNVAASSSTRTSRTTFGIVQLPAGSYSTGLGFTYEGSWSSAGGGASNTLVMPLSDSAGTFTARMAPGSAKVPVRTR